MVTECWIVPKGGCVDCVPKGVILPKYYVVIWAIRSKILPIGVATIKKEDNWAYFGFLLFFITEK